MEKKAALNALNALGQETRLDVFRSLVRHAPGGLKPGELSEELALAPATLSFHLKEMNHAGLVNVEQQGRCLIYSANLKAMTDLIGYLTENCCQGQGCATDLNCKETAS